MTLLLLLLAPLLQSPEAAVLAQTTPGALSWFDLDGDATVDVVLVGPGGSLRVLRRGLADVFEDVSATVGLPDLGPVVGIGDTTPSEKLDVAGNIRCVSLIQTSDARYKKNVHKIDGALESVLALRGVSYDWDLEKFPQGGTDHQLGFLAQEVRAVLPESVREDDQGMLAVSYTSVVPVLVEAVRELDAENRALVSRVAELEQLVSRITALEEAMAAPEK